MYLGRKKVFIAGATGMVGSAVAEALLKRFPRLRIRAACHTRRGFFLRDKRLEYVAGDLLREKDCLAAVKGCACAVMAAAVAENAATFTAGTNCFRSDNIAMNLNLLKAFAAHKVERAVFLSSATVYPPVCARLAEDDLDLNAEPDARQFSTGWSFRFLEKMCRFWQERTGAGMVVLRLANVFGPYARFDPQRANFIPALIRKAAQRIDPFPVWGRPDAARDVVYRDDAAAAIVTALNAVTLKYDCFNVGSGIALRVADVVDHVVSCAGYSPKIRYEKNAPTTVKTRLLDVSKIARRLGWKAQISAREGIYRTFKWWQENKRWWKR